MLPLLLGIIGLVFHYKRDTSNFMVNLMLFVLTGIAIVVYLNEVPVKLFKELTPANENYRPTQNNERGYDNDSCLDFFFQISHTYPVNPLL